MRNFTGIYCKSQGRDDTIWDMSGHSKWATIKRQKGANDVKRSAVFTKLSMAISIAVRQGGGITDPNQNFKLRLAMDAARNANMPKENIERAIQRAAGKAGEGNVDEAVYEGFGPQGISIIVETVTDNKNRTIGEVKNTFEKNGGTIGQPGSVSYQFKQVGQIIIDKNNKTIDDIFLEAADAGAQEVEEINGEVFIYTLPNDVSKIRSNLLEKGYAIKETDIIRQPTTFITVEEGSEAFQKIVNLLDKLESLDDVQKVYSNFESH